MEQVLEIYKCPYNPARPVVCMDTSPRCGVCSVFIANEPLAGIRMGQVTQTRTKIQWAHFLNQIAERWPEAERITLVMDNLNTHTPGALYEAFPAHQVKQLRDRFGFVYTPKHGS